MYCTAISPRFSRGRSTPAMRAIRRSSRLALALLVARVLADDPHDARAADDLAVLAPDLDRRLDFHAFLNRSSFVRPTARIPCADSLSGRFQSIAIYARLAFGSPRKAT